MSGGGNGGRNKRPSPGREQYSHLLDEMSGCGDMVLLEPLTEDSLVENLRTRYESGEIYTYIGPVVVSVNPYRQLSIYTPEYIAEYTSRNMYELPSHIFAVSDEAYQSLRDRNLDQCIIISGESGAGKTEASKLVMQYVAAVSGRGEEVDRVKAQLLQSNPVLEAFGNAKTSRNDNSSRFGKYMDIQFDFKGDPIGGLISNYLLEKSRVVSQNPGERSFHIFYQLLGGASDDVLQMLHLEREVFRYLYLSQSGSSSYSLSTEDNRQFANTMKAMEVVGFSPDEISSILELLAAILNLGNISFSGHSLPNGTDACKLEESPVIGYACDMLGCPVSLLEECLTTRSVHTKRDYVQKPLSEGEGLYARDALSKALYDRLFSWLVGRINDSIKTKYRGKKKVMGVLDIYGFEIFEMNSFEQFIINYCNEKLQQVFIDLTLKSEQDEYIREGVQWDHIDYFNNSIICDLIEHPSKGMLSLLDEECLRPGDPTDDTFLEKLNERCLDHAHFESRAMKELRSDATLERNQFRLVHYAGKVTYSVVGFLEKNQDLLYKDLSKGMYACERKLLKTLFPEGNPEIQTLKRPVTTGYQFRNSVAELMKNLLSKNPNYIRCIKPNDVKVARCFNEPLVRHQVRYLGLMENIRVRRAGFAYRQEYKQALARYKMLSPKTWPSWKGPAREGVKEVLLACGCHKLDFTCGRSKIFIRNPRTVFGMEDRRRERLHDLTTLISKTYRGFSQWKKYQTMRKAQIIISAWYRRYYIMKWYNNIRNSVVVVQKYYRGWKARVELRRLKWLKRATWAVGIIKKYFIGWQVRKAVRELRYRQKVRAAAVVIQKYCRGWKVRKEVRVLFKQVAGPKVAAFMWRALCCKFLSSLLSNLPSTSPLDRKWPEVSPLFQKTSDLLKNMHHHWRCKVMRDHYVARPTERRMMSEKVQASTLFKGKKSLYPQSVADPFKSDRISLRSDERWSKLVAETNEQRIIWAGQAHKLNRKDGKGVPVVFVVTGLSFMILDPKTLAMKYRVELKHLQQISLSSFSDHILVVHIDPFKATDRSYSKGDFILKTPHVVELVTKTHAVVQESLKKKIKIVINNIITAHFKVDDEPCTIQFHHDPSPHGPPGSPVCRRRSNTLQITVYS